MVVYCTLIDTLRYNLKMERPGFFFCIYLERSIYICRLIPPVTTYTVSR